MKTFAVAAKSHSRSVTGGKEYEVLRWDNDGGFYIISDTGFEIFCREKGCAHLDGGDWVLIEPAMADPSAQDHIDSMVADPTLDKYFDRNPAEISDNDLMEWVNTERQRRTEFIAAEASK